MKILFPLKNHFSLSWIIILWFHLGAPQSMPGVPHNSLNANKAKAGIKTPGNLNVKIYNKRPLEIKDDWFALVQNGKRYLPQQDLHSNSNKIAHNGIIFLPQKNAFDIYLDLEFPGQPPPGTKKVARDKELPKAYVRAPFKIKRPFFFRDQSDFRAGNGIANSGPYEHLYIMDYGFHYILPERCHNYDPDRKFSCRWHINSIQITPLGIMGPLSSFPFRTLPLVIWKDVNFDFKIQKSEKRFILIVFPE